MGTPNTAKKLEQKKNPWNPEKMILAMRPNLSSEEKIKLLDDLLDFVKPYLRFIPMWKFFGNFKFIPVECNSLSINEILDKNHIPHIITTEDLEHNGHSNRYDEFRYQGYDNLNRAFLMSGWLTVLESYNSQDSTVYKIAGFDREGHLVLIHVVYDKHKQIPVDENSFCKWPMPTTYFAENVEYFAGILSLFSKFLHQWVEARKDLLQKAEDVYEEFRMMDYFIGVLIRRELTEKFAKKNK